MGRVFYNWTFIPYAIYALTGVIMAYLYYNRNKELSVAASLTPLFGEKVNKGFGVPWWTYYPYWPLPWDWQLPWGRDLPDRNRPYGSLRHQTGTSGLVCADGHYHGHLYHCFRAGH